MKIVFAYLKKRSFLFLLIIAFFLTLAANGLAIFVPTLTGELVNSFIATATIDKGIQNKMLLFMILSFVLTFIQLLITSFLSEKLGYEIRNDLITKITNQTYAFVSKVTPEKILTNLTQDVSNVKAFLANWVTMLIISIFTIVGSFVLMLRINVTLSLWVLPVLPLLIFVFFFIIKKIIPFFKASQKAKDKINQSIDENIKASMLVRVFVSESFEKDKFNIRNEYSKKTSLNIINVFSMLIPLITLANYLAILVVLSVGSNLIINRKMNIGELLAFYQYVGLFITPITVLGFIGNAFGYFSVSASRIEDILTSKTKFMNGHEKLSKFKTLEMKNVQLSFKSKKKSQNVLSDINFKVTTGQKVGIVGETGSGKSLLLSMIPRFLEPNKGSILINGKEIKRYDIQSIRSKIGFVFQDNFIFTGTVRDNVLLGRETQASDTLFKLAVQTAEIEGFVDKLPGKFEEMIGERGVTLSGGQKQRITLARALFSNPEILILDDSTSKLDIETEQRIFKNISRNYPNITLIVVSQKIVSIKDSDIIYVMEGGEIESSGTHEKLLQNSFIYQEFELSQSDLADEL